MSSSEDESVLTTTPSAPRKKRSQSHAQSKGERPLSQEELRAWWPFDRLDPKRFPKTKHEEPEYEEALF